MTATEILQEWLKFSEYDPEQKTHDLLSVKYEYHRCCETIGKFLDYDPLGEFSVLYAKKRFMEILQEVRVKVFDILKEPELIANEIEMWRIFSSDDVTEIETKILSAFDTIFASVMPVKLLGEKDTTAEREILLESIPSVAEALHKCNVDLFLHGGHMTPVTLFSPIIHVFPTLAECLLALETAPDGMYICYIRCNDSADGYFGFYIKSNGNLLSVNERINEAYPGEHGNRRNHRWTESKEFALFPYSKVVSHSVEDQDGSKKTKRDYKGYVTDYIISDETIDIFSLDTYSYLPLMIAMVLLSNKYANCDTADMPTVYVDSLLPVNLALPTPGTQALTVTSGSLVAKSHKAFSVPFSAQDIAAGTHLELLGKKNLTKEWAEDFYGYKMNEENIFIELYGKDFQPDMAKILESNSHIKRLTSAELAVSQETPHPEFVGTVERMTAAAYMQGRQQLADYIREQMFKEYIAFGGTPAVKAWWEQAVCDNKDRILDMCAERYLKGEKYTWQEAKDEGIINWEMHTDCQAKPNFATCAGSPWLLNKHPLYPSGYENWNKALCPITGQASSHYFLFRIRSHFDIAKIVGGMDNLPKILMGYKESGHRGYTNNILNISDPVSFIGTPFEDSEHCVNRRLWSKDTWWSYNFRHSSNPCTAKIPDTALPYGSYMTFHFAVGVSKRGMIRLLKEREVK